MLLSFDRLFIYVIFWPILSIRFLFARFICGIERVLSLSGFFIFTARLIRLILTLIGLSGVACVFILLFVCITLLYSSVTQPYSASQFTPTSSPSPPPQASLQTYSYYTSWKYSTPYYFPFQTFPFFLMISSPQFLDKFSDVLQFLQNLIQIYFLFVLIYFQFIVISSILFIHLILLLLCGCTSFDAALTCADLLTGLIILGFFCAFIVLQGFVGLFFCAILVVSIRFVAPILATSLVRLSNFITIFSAAYFLTTTLSQYSLLYSQFFLSPFPQTTIFPFSSSYSHYYNSFSVSLLSTVSPATLTPSTPLLFDLYFSLLFISTIDDYHRGQANLMNGIAQYLIILVGLGQ